jgi:hypothetical protein
MINPGRLTDMAGLQELVVPAVNAARTYLATRRTQWDAEIAQPLQEHLRRLERWEQASLPGMSQVTKRKQDAVQSTVAEQRRLADSLRTSGQPFLRVLAVLEAGT